MQFRPPIPKSLILSCCLVGLGNTTAEEARDPATDAYFAANALYNRKLYSLAAEEFREFLNQHGGHPKADGARLGLALSVYGEGKFAEAEPLLAAQADKEREAQLLHAQCLLELGKPAGAAEKFAQARGRAGGDQGFEVRALAGLVSALIAEKKWQPAADRAKEWIDRTEDKSPAQLRARYQRGIALYEVGKFGEAAEELNRLVDAVQREENPYFGQALLLLGESLRETGDLEGGARRFDQAARDGGGAVAAEALFRLVYLRFEQQRFDDAIATSERLIREHQASPLVPRAAIFGGRAAFEKKDFGRAKAILEPLREHSEAGAEASYWLGRSLVKDNKPDEAERVFAAAEKRFPDDRRVPDISFERAAIWMSREKFAEAAAAFEGLAKKDSPRAAEALRLAATARYRQGEFGKALELCQRFEALAGGSISDDARADIAFLKSDIAFRIGPPDQAVDSLAAFVDKYPQHASHDAALLVLAAASEAKGDRPRAIAALDRLVREHGNSSRLAAALASLGRLRQAEGDRGGARAPLERLARDFPAAPERATGDYFLGFIARDEGKNEEAAKWFGGMADRFPKHELAADARLQQALALLGGDGRGEAGVAALERFAKDHPDDPRADDALYRAASARFESKAWQAAADRFAELVSRDSGAEFHARALYRLAWARRELKDSKAAAEAFRQLLGRHSEDPLAATVAIELAELSEDQNEVVGLLEQWIPRLPDAQSEMRERAHLRLGDVRLARGDTLEAAKAFEAAGRGDRAKLAAGEARLRLKEYGKAAEHLAAVAAAGPLGARALVRLGEVHALMDQWQESAKAYQSALDRGAVETLARHANFGIAWAAENLGERERAVGLYREIVAAGGRDETAARSQFQIGECRFAEGKFDAAVKEFIRVDTGYDFPAWRARAILEIGRALERSGSLEESAARYREVIERFPNSDAAPVAKDLLKSVAGN